MCCRICTVPRCLPHDSLLMLIRSETCWNVWLAFMLHRDSFLRSYAAVVVLHYVNVVLLFLLRKSIDMQYFLCLSDYKRTNIVAIIVQFRQKNCQQLGVSCCMFIVVYICDKHLGALTQLATSYGAFLLLHDCTCVLFSMLPKLYCCLKYFLCWSDCNTWMPLNTSDCCLALSGNVNCTDMLTYRNLMFSMLALVTQVYGSNFGSVQQASVRLSVTLSYDAFFDRCCCKRVCPCVILFQPVMVVHLLHGALWIACDRICH